MRNEGSQLLCLRPQETIEAIYDPEETKALRKAFEAAWSALAFVHWEGEADRNATSLRLARSILEAASQGERRVHILSGRALGAIEPRLSGVPSWHVSRSVS